MSFFIGIDGGGTKTRCILGDDRHELARGSASSCKVQRVGEACARHSLAAAIHEACVQAGISPQQIARTCAGITGSARAEIASVMRRLVGGIVGGEVEVVGDVEIAFEDAFNVGQGVIVIAGTGSIAYGRNLSGEVARAGGWGWAVSDEGSGHWVGTEAVRAVLRARDRGQPTQLLPEIQDALGAKSFDDFIVKLNASPGPDYSTLFPVVASSGGNGDSLAAEVLHRAGNELAKMTGVVVNRLCEGQACSVAMHGGVFSGSSIVRQSFFEALCVQSPQASLLQRVIDPARGALERARRGFNVVGA